MHVCVGVCGKCASTCVYMYMSKIVCVHAHALVHAHACVFVGDRMGVFVSIWVHACGCGVVSMHVCASTRERLSVHMLVCE